MMKNRQVDKYMKTLAAQIFNEEYMDYLNANDKEYSLSKELKQNLKSLSNKKNKKIKMTYIYRRFAICASLLLICGIIFSTLNLSNNPYKVLANEIDYNLEKLSELETDILTSSNPHAYKDTENYNNIVKSGPIAIDVLEQKYVNGELEGFNAYIAATAIEDIAGISLASVTGDDWSTAEEFFTRWDKMLSELPQTFKLISETDESKDLKIQKIKEYGILGEYYLSYINKSTTKSVSFFGCNISVDSLKITDNSSNSLSEEVYSEINNYLKKKCRN